MRERYLLHIERWIDICIYDQPIRSQMSLWRHQNRRIRKSWLLMNGSLKLVKVINHQCVILDDLNSTTEFVSFGRGRKNYRNCRECTAGYLLRNVNVVSSIRPAKFNDNRAERSTHLIINSITIEGFWAPNLGKPFISVKLTELTRSNLTGR